MGPNPKWLNTDARSNSWDYSYSWLDLFRVFHETPYLDSESS